MRLPAKKKPGDPVLASDWNLLLEAVAARTPRQGAGLELTAASGGFSYSSQGRQAQDFRHVPQFGVIGIEQTEDGFLVTLKEGWVIERQQKSGDHPAVKFHMPTSGGVPMNAVPRPQVAMETGESLWCRVQTNPSGAVIGTPELHTATDEPDGTHHKPATAEASGTNGEYFVKLLELTDDPGGISVRTFQQSDIEHWATLWTGTNEGGGARVFKSYDAAAAAYRFRTLAARSSTHQIAVAEDGDLIRVTGNGKAGALVLSGALTSPITLLGWDDGLVTGDGETAITVREYMICEYGIPKAVKFLVVE
jgi:hypothetical protein